MTPGITLISACLAYPGRVLFDDLNLAIPAGEWTCLLGPSGVGKTSLLRLIAGLHSTAVSSATHATDALPLRGRVAYLEQQPSLLPWLTVIQNIMIGTRLRGESCHKVQLETAEFLLSKVGLSNSVHDYPDGLSGGMKQRAMLARVLYEDKPIILMDEPFAALDIITRTSLQALAAEVLADRTILLVTHDPLEALRLGHHVYIMSGCPANISQQITVKKPPPRDLTDEGLIEMHAKILEKLIQAREAMVC